MTEIMPTNHVLAAVDYQERCDDCCGFKNTFDPAHLQLDQRVNFTTVTETSRGFRYSSKKGVITEIEGDYVAIKSRAGRTIRSRNEVTPTSVPSPLTYAFIGKCNCTKPEKDVDESPKPTGEPS